MQTENIHYENCFFVHTLQKIGTESVSDIIKVAVNFEFCMLYCSIFVVFKSTVEAVSYTHLCIILFLKPAV